ncbi:Sodium/calcium exchanger protein-domain-containing protein [Rhypophila decipiens]|uniref:Sodium/calcium exchanger protein-domain-containing protein n=1 Tax=Rhypophila decipiens TaxID=261697 RepID=A0AAN7B9C2_9PEZI|nr:Sodium/calcium exchanger protein-domain-containing protein [Rhypophila decipiens]
MTFNYYKNRKEFHSEGRWGDFLAGSRPTKRGRRNKTWDVAGEIESQPAMRTQRGDGDAPIPITHSQSAPGPFGQAFPDSDKETDPHDMGPYSSQFSSGGETSADSPAIGGPSDAPDLLRRRVSSKNESQNGPSETDRAPREKAKKPKKASTFFKHLTPKEPFTVGNQIRRTFLYSPLNILIFAAPIGIGLNFVPSIPRVAIFVINFLAIIPLAALLSYGTEEVALRLGETLGGLLNASLGNAVELIVAIIALIKGEIAIVQTSLIGSILSNLLLVMGMCFFFGGLRRQEQFFNTTVAQTAASMLALAVAGVIVPTVFDSARERDDVTAVAALSRGTSVILLVVYGAYLIFQLHTHSKVFAEESQKVEAKPFNKRSLLGKPSLKEGAIAQGFVVPAGVMGGHGLPSQQEDTEKLRELLTTPPSTSSDEDDEEEPQLHFGVALATLIVSTIIIALCAEFMVDSIDSITDTVSEEFVGLILLPIVGNAAEHATAVTVAIKDKMDLAIGVAVGSSMQVALFIIPLLVIIGWGMGNDAMNLSFDTFQVAVLFVAVLLVNYLIADGKSHWLEGFLLICLYAIIAVCAFWYPTDAVPV